MDEQGLPYALEKEIDPKGMTTLDIADGLSIPPDHVEAVFVNGKVKNIYDKVFPGDRLALCPPGTPGPYRVFLGMARENVRRAHKKKAIKKDKGKNRVKK
jgi:hypothetical protein